jgi:DNA relaxase NicK
LNGHITRRDGAVDDYFGRHIANLAVQLWEQGMFGTGGGYPKALAWMLQEPSRIRTIQNQLQISYEELTEHAARAFGRSIRVVEEVEGSAEKAVAKLNRDGVPKRLRHRLIDNASEWLE